MSRYPHIMRQSGGGKWPSRIVCVDASHEWTAGTHPCTLESPQLKQWSVVGLTREGQIYRVAADECGTTIRGWWEALAEVCRLPGTTWVICENACTHWNVLGLWEEIENARISMAEDYRATTAGIADRVRNLRRESCDPLRPIGGHVVRRMLEDAAGYLVTEDPPCILRASVGGSNGWVTWVDTRNYGVSVPIECRSGHSRARWIAGFVTDMCGVLQQYNMGSLCATAGSQALRGLRHGYLTGQIYCHVHPGALDLERGANCGGRCECLRIGPCPHPVRQLDYRAVYPSICTNLPLPARLVRYDDRGGPGDTLRESDGLGCIAEVDVETDEPAYPCRAGADTIYPVGRFRTVLAGPELVDAIIHGRVYRWHRLALYEMEGVLSGYARATLRMREYAERQGDVAIGMLAKRLGVSIVGKLAQRYRRWEPCEYIDPHELYGEWWGSDNAGGPCRYRAIAGNVLREADLGYSEDASPALSAWITSAGRMKLLAAIRIAGWHNVYYYDTDSVFVTEEGYVRLSKAGLICPGQPGKLQEAGGPYHLVCRGIKSYIAGERDVCAGRPSTCYHGWDNGDRGNATSQIWQDIRSGIRPRCHRESGGIYGTAHYRHGIVGSEGAVRPIRLEEW